ncbi:MAG: DUF2807 domain-containing protein [Acidimicrobiia bacterium]|nr:DUF2807 domain-containing protein [Acidimicrobiia bacterium]
MTGCEGTVPFGGLSGSGDLMTESRTVGGFDEIVVLGSGNVLVDVTGTETLEIEAEDNIMEFLTTEVVNGRLELGVEPGKLLSPRRDINYTITASQLDGVTITGSGNIDATDIDTDTFEVTISGSGDVEPAGTSNHLLVTISGSGRFDGTALESVTGEVRVSGSGNVVVNVTGELSVSVSGSGDVQYIGDPALNSSVSGSGDVTRR